MSGAVKLPIIDLASPDRISIVNSIHQACTDCGFFYVVNHGIEKDLFAKVFDESSKFFSLPLQDKLKLLRHENRGYSPLYTENLHPSLSRKGDSKETFNIGPLEEITAQHKLNQWPSQEILPSWRPTMESYYTKVLSIGKTLISLIALALKLDEDYFEKNGAMVEPDAFLRLLHYPELESSNEEIVGAYPHSDYGSITLLSTDGVPGLQVCRDKNTQPRVWEDVQSIDGAFIINIGDMMERWTNCKFRSTLHRVMPAGQERYSAAFFLDPSPNCVVECLKTCCSESCPPRFPPICSGDYVKERFRVTYSSYNKVNHI